MSNAGISPHLQARSEPNTIAITMDRGPSFSITLQELRHIEYGYATTSHSSQGTTIDRVLVNIDTEQSVALVNQQQFYVSISRARQEVRIFTNKQDELAQVISRSWPKATTLDAITQFAGSLRASQGRGNRPPYNVPPQETHAQSLTGSRPLPAHVSVSRSEDVGQPGHERQPGDVAQRVSHHQTDWRRAHQPPTHEPTLLRAPIERSDERQVPPREEELKQQPQRSRGIRYRM